MSGPVVGILVCDHVPRAMRDVAGGDYGELYTSMLRGSQPTLGVRVYDVVGGELPASPDECDAWIITGSRHDADGDDPWLVALRDLVVRLRAARARTVGICFGHQLLAHALGGRAERGPGWKVGPQSLEVEATPWFPGGRVHLDAMHRDVVTALPDGATAIGTGSTADLPIFLVGEEVLGIQDHPEFAPAYTAALITARREHIGEAVADAGLAALATTPTDGPEVARWLTDFLLDRRR